MEKVLFCPYFLFSYAGITQIRSGRSLTLPLRLYTDSLYLPTILGYFYKKVKDLLLFFPLTGRFTLN